MKEISIFCDFDGTITTEDTIDKLLSSYATPKWLDIEEQWEKGIIGSKECLRRQIDCINNFSSDMLNDFIMNCKIDEQFIQFYATTKNNNIEFCIISDGFDALIKGILRKYKLNDIKIYSNSLLIENQKLKTLFPASKIECEARSGLCKCSVLKERGKNKKIVYIGDGRSDMCAAKHADILYAKGKLASFAKEQGINHVEFRRFNDILADIKIWEDRYFVNI